MKKIIRCYCSLMIIMIFSCDFTFGQGIAGLDPCLGRDLSSCCCPSNWATSSICQDGGYIGPNTCNQGGNTNGGEEGGTNEGGSSSGGTSDLGINITTDCLLNGQCSLNVYKVLGIRKSNENPTVLGFFQDITLASTTAILGTVLVIALIVSGLVFSFASITGKDTKRSKSILIDCLVGVLLVWGAYAIIRLIQFLATAGS